MTTSPRSGQRCPDVDIRPPSRSDRWLLRRMLEAMGHPPISFVLWNGEEVRGSTRERPLVRMHLGDRRLLREILRSDG
jgi:hypothetical protein